MKRVLVTAGSVYGRLDDNKIVGNRIRGIWAMKFAEYLAIHDWRDDATTDYRITLLVPDTMPQSRINGCIGRNNVKVVRHSGFEDYQTRCIDLAKSHDTAVMAAAVVNWVPKEPYSGKMPTAGYQVGDTIQIPFILAPRVINAMRKQNPNLTLIGCKMLIDSEREELIEAAGKVIRASKAHVVIANDQTNLHTKLLVFPDRTVIDLEDLQHASEWENRFYEPLRAIIDDAHWWTTRHPTDNAKRLSDNPGATTLFDTVVDKYRDRFSAGDGGKAFGSVLVPLEANKGYLASPRVKGQAFTSADASYIHPFVNFATRCLRVGTVNTNKAAKATMNAPLLVRMSQAHPNRVILHLHEQLPAWPTQSYAPPGTDRDCLRDISGPAFNIRGHGFIAALNEDLELPGL